MDAAFPSSRPAAVAGLFYPGDADTLRQQVNALLAAAIAPESDIRPVKALIAPHAGYVYSGPIAARAYAPLRAQADAIRRVVLLGPSHHVAFRGIAAPRASCFSTPLGEIPVDTGAIEKLARTAGVVVDDRPHTREHSLEVQLPFLQLTLKDFRIVPLCLGLTDPECVRNVLEVLWGGTETLIIASSDLSHYLDYATACAADRHSIREVRELHACLTPEQACGSVAINGLLLAASQHGLIPVIRDIRNSGDTAGDHHRVVGYAAVSFLPVPDTLH